MGKAPAVWAASNKRGTDFCLHAAAIGAISWTVPVTFDAWFTHTNLVSVFIASIIRFGVHGPERITFDNT